MRIQKMANVIVFMLLQASPLFAQEARVELRSTVIGNQEQPKVLYILPWQQAQSLQLSYQPLQSLVNGVFEEVERTEFLRELHYREKINASMQTKP